MLARAESCSLCMSIKKEMKGNRMYKLLTPGPLTTSETVKKSDADRSLYLGSRIQRDDTMDKKKLLELAQVPEELYTTVLMQGSGSFGVESVLSTVIRPEDTLLICSNGAYGQRMVAMCKYLQLNYAVYEVPEHQIPPSTYDYTVD